ncbi:hypothetical protein ACFVAV_27700 [Nocardia sp. NPDC057663]|uniref:hypothetical protein n=1 Tax=Nocardia sp. NPDC057663 TaxID=3346201 RepID=UPI00366CFF5D
MNDFAVQVASLDGFGLDLQDLGTNFSSNASRMLSELSLPRGSAGLLGSLTSSFENLQTTLSAVHQQDLTSLSSYRTNLATASRQFQGTDDSSAQAISSLSASTTTDQAAGASGGDAGITRFSGLQLPTLPAVADGQFTVRQVVDSAIELLTQFDEPLSRVIGVKPAADYLAPLAADWETLETLGGRIMQLGINDFVASENLASGVRWLQGSWSGSTAQAFAASTSSLGQAVATRSSDLDVVSKIVTNGGACLERLVYNQAMGWSGGLTQSMSFLGFTLPLGAWAQQRVVGEQHCSALLIPHSPPTAQCTARKPAQGTRPRPPQPVSMLPPRNPGSTSMDGNSPRTSWGPTSTTTDPITSTRSARAASSG